MLSHRTRPKMATTHPGSQNENRGNSKLHPNIKSGPTNKKRPRRSSKCNSVILRFCAIALLLLLLNIWGHYKLASQPQPLINSQPHQLRTSTSGRRNNNQNYHEDPLQAPKQQRQPTNHACDGYRGIYHIEKGDIGGAAGTVFFQFVIGQLMWADIHNFKPWVFLNNVSYVIYDPLVHGRGPGVDMDMLGGMMRQFLLMSMMSCAFAKLAMCHGRQ